MLVAESSDARALDELASRTRVVLSTAGPFMRLGSALVAACVARRTHYVDITGETPWVRDLIDRHHSQAAAEGTRIVPCCGFDSVPADLGAWLVVRYLREQLGVGCGPLDGCYRVSGGVNGGTLATVFLLTSRGIPLIYYGDEIGLAGGGEPDNRRDFPGGFTGDSRNAFEASGRTPEEQRLWTDIQTVARFRRQSPALRRGDLVQLTVEDQVYAYARRSGGETVLVVFNNASAPQSVRVPLEPLGTPHPVDWAPVLGGGTVDAEAKRLRLPMPARSVRILRATGR